MDVAAKFTGDGQGRTAAQSVAFDRLGDSLRVVGTNLYALIVVEAVGASLGPVMEEEPFCIPNSDAKRIGRILKKLDGEVNVYLGDERIRFALEGGTDDEQWFATLVKSSYFGWKELVGGLRREPVAGTLMYDLPEMAAILRLAQKDKAERVRIEATSGGVRMATEGCPEDNWGREVASGFWVGDEYEHRTLWVNADYMLTAVLATDGAPMRVMVDAMRPVHLTDSGRMAFVMPIRKPPTAEAESQPKRAAR